MTNEQLATFIHNGDNDELIPLLWDNVRALVYMKAHEYYTTHITLCISHGVELCDLKQVGYIAFTAALKAFKPESGLKFVSFLSFPLLNEINVLLGIRTKKRDALNEAASLDAPVKDEENDGATLGDLQADAQSTEFVQRIEAAMISEFIRKEVEVLSSNQRNVITWYYFDGKTLEEIAQELHVSAERVRQIKHEAEKNLRHVPELRLIYNEYYRCHTSHNMYFAWQPENYAAIRREEAAERKLTKGKTAAEILAEYRALKR